MMLKSKLKAQLGQKMEHRTKIAPLKKGGGKINIKKKTL